MSSPSWHGKRCNGKAKPPFTVARPRIFRHRSRRTRKPRRKRLRAQWGIILATPNTIGGRDHHSISKTSRSRARGDAMGPTRPRHHLHGDDRQPAIRLDAVHRSDRTEVPLGPGGHSGRLHDLRRDRNVAAASRGVLDRSFRPAGHGVHRRRAGRDRLGHQFRGRLARSILPRRHHHRARRQSDLRRHRRQCAEMVPRPARPCRRPHLRRLRCRRSPHRCAPRQHDPIPRV